MPTVGQIEKKTHTSNRTQPRSWCSCCRPPKNYSLRLSEGRWRVYGISVDTVCLVTNYRGTFASAIRRDGLEDLIARMEGQER